MPTISPIRSGTGSKAASTSTNTHPARSNEDVAAVSAARSQLIPIIFRNKTTSVGNIQKLLFDMRDAGKIGNAVHVSRAHCQTVLSELLIKYDGLSGNPYYELPPLQTWIGAVKSVLHNNFELDARTGEGLLVSQEFPAGAPRISRGAAANYIQQRKRGKTI